MYVVIQKSFYTAYLRLYAVDYGSCHAGHRLTRRSLIRFECLLKKIICQRRSKVIRWNKVDVLNLNAKEVLLSSIVKKECLQNQVVQIINPDREGQSFPDLVQGLVQLVGRFRPS